MKFKLEGCSLSEQNEMHLLDALGSWKYINDLSRNCVSFYQCMQFEKEDFVDAWILSPSGRIATTDTVSTVSLQYRSIATVWDVAQISHEPDNRVYAFKSVLEGS